MGDNIVYLIFIPLFITGVSEAQHANRMLLQGIMLKHGFRPLDSEWWHFTLENEPWPDTYFTFPVRNDFNH